MTASASSVLLREKILKKCRDDIYQFLNHENGQVAIYDAVNALASNRKALAQQFARHDVQVCQKPFSVYVSSSYHVFKTLFIESACDDERIIEENVRNVKISSPDVILIQYVLLSQMLIGEVHWLVIR